MYEEVETIGQRLRALRKSKKATQKQVAEAVGISPNNYALLERGEIAVPRTGSLERFADYFKVSTDYILGRSKQRKPVKPIRKVRLSDYNGVAKSSIGVQD